MRGRVWVRGRVRACLCVQPCVQPCVGVRVYHITSHQLRMDGGPRRAAAAAWHRRLIGAGTVARIACGNRHDEVPVQSRRRCGASRGTDVGRFQMRQRSHCANVSPYVNGSSDFLKQMSELHSNMSNSSEAALSFVETARW